jgi:hypothetical protein
MRWQLKVKVFPAVFVAALLLPACASIASAQSVRPDIVGLFPRDVGEFAYADLKSARRFGWYAQMKDQMLPSRFRQFEQFLISAGMDPDRTVNEMVWAAMAPTAERGEQIVGVAMGQFAPESMEDSFKAQKLPTIKVRGFTLFAFGTGDGPSDIFFFFIDSNTSAFGHRWILEQLIDVRYGIAESLLRSDKFYPLIDEVNGRGLVWAVMDQGYARLGLQQLAPEIAQFPDATKLVSRLKALTLRIEADRHIEARFQAICEAPDDANVFASLIQAGLLYRRYQEKDSNPELAKTLEEVQVTPSGERLTISMALSEEMLLALLRRNTFAVRM